MVVVGVGRWGGGTRETDHITPLIQSPHWLHSLLNSSVQYTTLSAINMSCTLLQPSYYQIDHRSIQNCAVRGLIQKTNKQTTTQKQKQKTL